MFPLLTTSKKEGRTTNEVDSSKTVKVMEERRSLSNKSGKRETSSGTRKVITPRRATLGGSLQLARYLREFPIQL